MHPFVTAALAANRAIAHRLADGITPQHRLRYSVGAGGDISSGIDLEAEAIFVEHLQPFGRIESEESGVMGSGNRRIVLDPIDGSSNMLSGFPYYGTSAALIDATGEVVAACIGNLAAGAFIFWEQGSSAQYGHLHHDTWQALRPIPDAEIGIFERAYAHPDVVRSLGDLGWKFRVPGAVALSLVYAVRARFFLYVGRYRAYDFAAGLAILGGMEVEAKEDYVIVTHDKETLEILRDRIRNRG